MSNEKVETILGVVGILVKKIDQSHIGSEEKREVLTIIRESLEGVSDEVLLHSARASLSSQIDEAQYKLRTKH